jgi:2-hydroxy-3-oxopropionate reductase
MTSTIALIGAGAMGGAIGQRLIETSHQVVAVFDLDQAKVRDLVNKGARAAPTAARGSRSR